MFRASIAHLQEDTVVQMQRILLSLSVRFPQSSCVPTESVLTQAVYLQSQSSLKLCTYRVSPHSSCVPTESVLTHAVYLQATRNSHREWQYHTLHLYNCILLKMSTWGLKHVEEINILWINNNQCKKVGN